MLEQPLYMYDWYGLRPYVIDDTVRSSLDIIQARGQVKPHKGGVAFTTEPFTKARGYTALIFEQVVHIFGPYIGAKINPG